MSGNTAGDIGGSASTRLSAAAAPGTAGSGACSWADCTTKQTRHSLPGVKVSLTASTNGTDRL
jgi:hypothetical protein